MKLVLAIAAAAALGGCATYGDPYGYGYPSGAYPSGAYPSNVYPSPTIYQGMPGYGAYGGYSSYPGYPAYSGYPHPVYPAPAVRNRDRDGDGVPNRIDIDRDGDGIPNDRDSRPNNPNRR